MEGQQYVEVNENEETVNYLQKEFLNSQISLRLNTQLSFGKCKSKLQKSFADKYILLNEFLIESKGLAKNFTMPRETFSKTYQSLIYEQESLTNGEFTLLSNVNEIMFEEFKRIINESDYQEVKKEYLRVINGNKEGIYNVKRNINLSKIFKKFIYDTKYDYKLTLNILDYMKFNKIMDEWKIELSDMINDSLFDLDKTNLVNMYKISDSVFKKMEDKRKADYYEQNKNKRFI